MSATDRRRRRRRRCACCSAATASSGAIAARRAGASASAARRRRPCPRRPTAPHAIEVAAQPAGAAVLGERVEDGVGGGVAGAGPPAPSVPAIEENSTNASRSRSLVSSSQVARRRRASRAARSSSCSRVSDSSSAAVVDDPGGVHDGGQRPVGRVPARTAASASRSATSQAAMVHARAQRASSSRSSAAPRRVGAPAADQHQVLGARLGQPAGDVPAERAGAAGDQHRAARPARPADAAGRRGRPRQPAAEHARTRGRRPGPRRRSRPARPASRSPRRVVQGFRQVDQAAPALRVLQARRPGPRPQSARLPGLDEPVGPAGGHRAAGGAPQRRVDPGVARACIRAAVSARPQANAGGSARLLGEAEQRQHAGESGRRTRPAARRAPRRSLIVDLDLGTVRGRSAASDVGDVLPAGDDQPGPGQRGSTAQCRPARLQ